MNIAHISTSTTTGAFSAAMKMHKILQENGHNSLFYTKYVRINHDEKSNVFVQNKLLGFYLNFRDKFIAPLFKRIINRKRSSLIEHYCYFQLNDYDNEGINIKLVNEIPDNIDVLFVHWVSGFINSVDVMNIQKITKCKVIYTMMDMAPITGGCHYSHSCDGFKFNCQNCPAIEYSKKFLPTKILNIKALNILKSNAKLLTFSQRDLLLAKESHIEFSSYNHCLLPFDIDIFLKNSKIKKTTTNEIHILSCAFSENNSRKGPNYLFEVLIRLDKLVNYTIYVHHIDLSFEKQYEFRFVKFVKFNFTNNIEEYALIFQKIDLLIFTSIADAAPQMIFESLLSGVPVVSFDVGYVNELIINKKNGFIVELYNTLQMTNKIIELVNLISTNKISKEDISNFAFDYYKKNSFEYNFNSILNS